jgi:hypothetical protein
MDRNARITASLPVALLLSMAAAQAIAADSPAKLRSEMAKAEREYVELYNQLNADPQFQILCVNEKPTGSSFATRVCRPRYLMDATRASARESLDGAVASGGTASSASAGGPAVGAQAGTNPAGQPGKEAAFKQHVLDIMAKNPQLRALGAKRDELQQRLEAGGGK